MIRKEVTIYYSRIIRPVPQAKRTEYFVNFPEELIRKNEKYRRWQDRDAHLVGRLMLLHGLKERGEKQDVLHQVQYSDFGKPFLSGDLEFNISHSGELVICAVADNVKVGVDIEEIRDVRLNDYAEVMSEKQWRYIHHSTEPIKTFFKQWAIKESIIKSDGRGLSIPLNRIEITNDIIELDGAVWNLHELNLDNNYAAYLSTSEKDIEITFKELIF